MTRRAWVDPDLFGVSWHGFDTLVCCPQNGWQPTVNNKKKDIAGSNKKQNPTKMRHERTIKYYPKDGDFEAKEETNLYLLATMFLEMFNTTSIPQASQRNNFFTKQEIHEYIAKVESSKEVQDFFSSIFVGGIETSY